MVVNLLSILHKNGVINISSFGVGDLTCDGIIGLHDIGEKEQSFFTTSFNFEKV